MTALQQYYSWCTCSLASINTSYFYISSLFMKFWEVLAITDNVFIVSTSLLHPNMWLYIIYLTFFRLPSVITILQQSFGGKKRSCQSPCWGKALSVKSCEKFVSNTCTCHYLISSQKVYLIVEYTHSIIFLHSQSLEQVEDLSVRLEIMKVLQCYSTSGNNKTDQWIV